MRWRGVKPVNLYAHNNVVDADDVNNDATYVVEEEQSHTSAAPSRNNTIQYNTYNTIVTWYTLIYKIKSSSSVL